MAQYILGEKYYYKPIHETEMYEYLGELLDIEYVAETYGTTYAYLTFDKRRIVGIEYIVGTFKEINEKCIFTENEYKNRRDKTYDLRAFDIREITEIIKGYRDCKIILTSQQYQKLPSHVPELCYYRNIFIEIINFEGVLNQLDYLWHLYSTDTEENTLKLPTNVFFNDKKKATTLMFDKDATVVKCGKDDKYSRRIGFLEAYFQATCGLSKTQAKKYLDKIVEDKEVKKK